MFHVFSRLLTETRVAPARGMDAGRCWSSVPKVVPGRWREFAYVSVGVGRRQLAQNTRPMYRCGAFASLMVGGRRTPSADGLCLHLERCLLPEPAWHRHCHKCPSVFTLALPTAESSLGSSQQQQSVPRACSLSATSLLCSRRVSSGPESPLTLQRGRHIAAEYLARELPCSLHATLEQNSSPPMPR